MTLKETTKDGIWYYQSRTLDSPTKEELAELEAAGWQTFQANPLDNIWIAWKKFYQEYDWSS